MKENGMKKERIKFT